MMNVLNIFPKYLSKNLFLITFLILFLCFFSVNAYSYWGQGASCAQERIFDEKGLSQDEISKINNIYKTQFEACNALKALVDLDAEKSNLSWYEYPLIKNLDIDKDIDENGNITDKELKDELDALTRRYPNTAKTLKQKLAAYAQAKNQDPNILKKSQELKTSNFTGGVGATLAEASKNSNTAGFGNDEAARVIRQSAYEQIVANTTTSNNTKNEVIKDFADTEKIISTNETFGLTDSQATRYVNSKEDAVLNITISNKSCRIDEMEKKYKSSCYSCIVVKTLLEKFIDACTKVNDLCRNAAVQILLVATLIWVAFWGLRTMSSLSSLEPASMIATLLVQAFKILLAYIIIESGIDVFLIYVVSPLLTAGADFGTALLNSTNDMLSMTPSPTYTYSGVELLDADMLNKILGFTESLDRVASDNLVIGHALTCHSTHAGAWANTSILGFAIVIPNIWIWLCGAAIWFAGFMLVLAVGYYLLDISFKIGLAILVFPMVMALWPFSLTSGKVKICIKTMLTSAATFAFLAITVSYGMSMINVALRDISDLKKNIEAGNAQWVANTFDITGPYFILILFAYLYALKLISSTIKDYVNKFFGGGLLANSTPMHSEMTRMTDVAKKVTVGGAKLAVGAVSGAAGKVIGTVADKTIGKATRFVTSKFKKTKQ